MKWGKLALFCSRRPTACYICLTMRYWYYVAFGMSSVIKKRPQKGAALLVKLLDRFTDLS